MNPQKPVHGSTVSPVRLRGATPTRLEKQLAASLMEVRAKKLREKMTNTTLATRENAAGAIAERVVILGDLSQLNAQQRSEYYIKTCQSLDLNPLTRPFSYLKLNGREILYANKDCSDQLRKRDKVSVTIVSREEVGDLLVITARATLPDGRCDESIGALPLGKLTGEARANALMKCETKAKRRVTLSICGLGFLDETEMEGQEWVEREQTHQAPQLAAINPHTAPGEDPAAEEDVDLVTDLSSILEGLKADIAAVDSYDRVLELQAILGSKRQQTELLKRLQAGRESGAINATSAASLGKLWQHCFRQLQSAEKALATGPEDALVGDGKEEASDG